MRRRGRHLALAAGLVLVAAGVAVFLGAPADDPRGFPAAEDLLILSGLALTILGVAGRAPRGRQALRD
ncbi:MAG: hypothetical protein KC486_19435 [Myxococcales bacterium]|nr:hypothetical protein [Myxococcales bacterium]